MTKNNRPDTKVFFANISSNMADREKLTMGIIIRTGKSMLCLKLNRSDRSNGSGDMANKVVKLRCLRSFFEKISKDMIYSKIADEPYYREFYREEKVLT